MEAHKLKSMVTNVPKLTNPLNILSTTVSDLHSLITPPNLFILALDWKGNSL